MDVFFISRPGSAARTWVFPDLALEHHQIVGNGCITQTFTGKTGALLSFYKRLSALCRKAITLPNSYCMKIKNTDKVTTTSCVGTHEPFGPPSVLFQVWGTQQSLPTQRLGSHAGSPTNPSSTSGLGTSYDAWIHHPAAQSLTHCFHTTKPHLHLQLVTPSESSSIGIGLRDQYSPVC